MAAEPFARPGRIPVFPPLMSGLACGPADPFPIACAEAARGTQSGLLVWALDDERLRAALVLAPEIPLEPAMAAFRACAVGLQGALGALAPPETAVQLDWTGGIRVNGGHCGGLRIAAGPQTPSPETPSPQTPGLQTPGPETPGPAADGSGADPAAAEAIPDWLVVGLEVTLRLPPEWEPGETPDWTALLEEGCGEVEPIALLEAWSRHAMVWLSRLEEPEGRAALHGEWQGYAWNRGQRLSLPLEGRRIEGVYLGDDENFGMLLKLPEGGTRLIPASVLIEEP